MAKDPFRRSPLTAAATVLRRLAALLTVLGMTIGVPAGLVTYFGNPMPDALPSGAAGWQDLLTAGFTDETVIGLVVVCLWAVWALWVYSLLIETISLLSGRASRARGSFSPMRGMAAALIAGILATPAAAMAATAPAPAAAAVAIAAPQSQPAASAVSWTMPGTTAQADVEVVAAVAAPAEAQVRADLPRFAVAAQAGMLTVDVAGQRHTIEVNAGDTLWGIADKCLGDGARYGEIYELNKDRYDSSGRMLGGEHIEAGWVLALPADASMPAGAQPATPPAPPETVTPPAAETPAPVPPTASPQAVTPTPPVTEHGDGVAPIPTHAPTSASPTAPSSATPAVEQAESGKPGVSLPGGSWVDLGLAAAVTAAAGLVWRWRRRRYTPRPPAPGARDHDPDLRPLPKVAVQVRRGLRTGPKLLALADTVTPAVEAQSPILQPVAEPAVGALPVTPALDSDLAPVWSPAGLGLTGPGALAAARGLLAATLANGDVTDPHRHSRIVIPASTLATLLCAGALDVAATPRLTVTSDLDEALVLMETTALHRSRLVYAHEADDVTGVRAADPLEEPMPPLVLLADTTTSHAQARLAALLTQGRRLDLHGILLGEWAPGHTVVVDADGATTPDPRQPHTDRHPADVGRLAVLDPDETADLLRLLAEAHTGLAQPAPTVPAREDELGHDEKKADACAVEAEIVEVDTAAVTDDLDAAGQAPVGAPVRIAVLGGFDVAAGVDVVPDGDSLRAKGRELLIFLAENGGKASKDTLIEELLPDAKITSAHHRLNTISSNVRVFLKRHNGPGAYLERQQHHYVLRREAVDVDLWRMRDALAAFAACPPADRDGRVRALREALAAYGGPLADGLDIDWIDVARNRVARQALDAHIGLAELLADTDPAEAANLLDRAIAIDPTAEDTYRLAIRQRAALGDAAAVRGLRRALTAAMSDIDTDPREDILALADDLLADLRTRANGR